MAKPKVLFVLHLPPPTHGAAMVGQYIKQSQVINEAFETDYIDLATNRVLHESGKGSLKKIAPFLRIIRQVTAALKSKKYDLCYMTLTVSGAGFYKDALVVFLMKLWRPKIIYHFHNKGVSENFSKISRSLYSYVFKDTKSILVSRFLYPDIKAYVKEKDVFYCPCGIPGDALMEDVGTQRPVKAEKDICQLLFLSNMMREKGIFVLLEACDILRRKGIPFQCHYVGGWSDVPEEEFIRQIREKELTHNVFVHGPKYKEDKLAFFAQADIFVFPTHYDTFGLVNLEAMQCGLPIISTPEGGIPDIVTDGETGFLVLHNDVRNLAEKIALLIKDPVLRYNMGAKGRQRFYKHFTLEVFENNMTRILKEAVNQNQTNYSLPSVL